MMDYLSQFGPLSSPQYYLLPVFWVVLGKIKLDSVGAWGRKSGEFVSNLGQRVPGWNKVVEPMIVQQLSRIFLFSSNFVYGLTEDNDNKAEMQSQMQKEFEEIRTHMAESKPTPSVADPDGSDTTK